MSSAGLQPDFTCCLFLMPPSSCGWDGRARHQHSQLSNMCLPSSSVWQHWDYIWVLCWLSHFGGVPYLVSTSFGDCIRSFGNCIDWSFISQYAASLFLANEYVQVHLKVFPWMKTCLLYTDGYAQITPNNNNFIFFPSNDTTQKVKASRNNYKNRKYLIKIIILWN